MTAIEWLEGFFYSESKELGFDKWVIPGYQMERIIDYAKKMEKEQLEKAIEFGYELRNNNKPINSGIDWVKEFKSINK